MSTNYHTALVDGDLADAAHFNAPLGTLDAQITTNTNSITAILGVGGNVASLTNGAASAGQKVVTLDSTTGFIANARVAYSLVGGTLEYNTIDTIDSATQLTLDTNIGTGGIADDAYFSMIGESEYQAAQIVPHGTGITFTLTDTINHAAAGIIHAERYASIQEAITAAAAVPNGIVKFESGKTYDIDTTVTVTGDITIDGNGATFNASEGITQVFLVTGSNVRIRQAIFTGTTNENGIRVVGDVGSECENVSIDDCKFDGLTDGAIYFNYARNVFVRGIVAESIGADGTDGVIRVYNSERVVVDGVSITDCHVKGVAVAYSTDVTIANIHTDGMTHNTVPGNVQGMGIYVGYDCDTVNVVNCSCRNNEESGIKISKGATNVTISNSYFENGAYSAVYVQGATNVVLSHVIAVATGGEAAIHVLYWDAGNRSQRVRIADCMCLSSGDKGIFIEDSDDIDIDGNTIYGPYIGIDSCANVRVLGNYVVSAADSTTACINAASTTGLLIRDNVVRQSHATAATKGIQADTCASAIIAQNDVVLSSSSTSSYGINAASVTAAKINHNLCTASVGTRVYACTDGCVTHNTIDASYIGIWLSIGSNTRCAHNMIVSGLSNTGIFSGTDYALLAYNVIGGANWRVTFTGAGLNDMTKPACTYTGGATKNFIVAIDGTGTPNTFKWSNNGGSSYTAGVNITGSPQLLANGVSITFAATTGHTLNDAWSWSQYGINDPSTGSKKTGNVSQSDL